MESENVSIFQWKLAGIYFLCLAVYTLLIILANWLAFLDIFDKDNVIYRLATYGASMSAFGFEYYCEYHFGKLGYTLGKLMPALILLVYVFTFAGVAIGVEKLFEYTVDYFSKGYRPF